MEKIREKSEKPYDRNISLDLLRIIACISIIALHYSGWLINHYRYYAVIPSFDQCYGSFSFFQATCCLTDPYGPFHTSILPEFPKW
jgi:hypothetical protein